MGVSTGVGDGDTLGAANGWDLWDSWDLWVGLIGPLRTQSAECAPDAATLIDGRPLLAPRF